MSYRKIFFVGIVFQLAAMTSPSYAQNAVNLMRDTVCKEPASSNSNQPQIKNACSCLPAEQKIYLEIPEVGEVGLKIDVDEASNFVGVSVVKSSGFKFLDRTGVRTVALCKFRAAVVNGKAIRSSLNLTYGWKAADDTDSTEVIAYFK